MTARLLAVLVALLCLLALAFETRAKPRDNSPSRLEKTCPAGPFYVPCFTMDEALVTTWDI